MDELMLARLGYAVSISEQGSMGSIQQIGLPAPGGDCPNLG